MTKAREGGMLYTVGYGGRGKEGFLELLNSRDIRTVVDVRLRPDRASMGIWVRARNPEQGLEGWLTRAGIDYLSLVELGNLFMEVPDWARRYRELLRGSGELLAERLADVPLSYCLMCAEKRATECHRHLIAEYLAARWHVEVEHLE